ncbi:MAG: type II secretion system protein, partial [Planctomycetota bacterium]
MKTIKIKDNLGLAQHITSALDCPKCRLCAGFTLIELMIAVGLMAFIMVLVAAIFSQTSSTVTIGGDRLNIYSEARAALDMFVTDINGCFPLDTGQQRFTLGEDKEGEDISGARDRIS